MLSELEEVIQYKLVPERREIIRETWWERLQVRARGGRLSTSFTNVYGAGQEVSLLPLPGYQSNRRMFSHLRIRSHFHIYDLPSSSPRSYIYEGRKCEGLSGLIDVSLSGRVE